MTPNLGISCCDFNMSSPGKMPSPQASLQQRADPDLDLAGQFFEHTDQTGAPSDQRWALLGLVHRGSTGDHRGSPGITKEPTRNQGNQQGWVPQQRY